MTYCITCGKSLHESALFCPHCGATQKPDPAHPGTPAATPAATAPAAAAAAPAHPAFAAAQSMPEGVKGWSWGAFWLCWIWAIANKTWIGLLALIPFVNLIMSVVLGIKGREWAWQNNTWTSLEHFNRVQRNWSIAGWIVGAIYIAALIGLSMHFINEEAQHNASAAPTSAEMQPPTPDTHIILQAPPAAAPPPAPAARVPFQQPTLIGLPLDYFAAMQHVGMEPHWQARFSQYLNEPARFWSECVSQEAHRAQMLGGLSSADAQAHGQNACQQETAHFYDCLHQKPVNFAVMCLHAYTMELASVMAD